MLSFNLKPIFDTRGIERPYSYLVKNGFTPHSATKIINDDLKSIHIDIIERLCILLVCEPSDMFTWTPDKTDVPILENHPLHKLEAGEHTDLKEALANIPLSELKNNIELNVLRFK